MDSASKLTTGRLGIMTIAQLKTSLMLIALLVGACFTLAQEPQVAQPPPPITFPDWKEVDRTQTAIEYSISFPSAMETPYPANNTVPLRVLMPAEATGPVPAVIVLHYW